MFRVPIIWFPYNVISGTNAMITSGTLGRFALERTRIPHGNWAKLGSFPQKYDIDESS